MPVRVTDKKGGAGMKLVPEILIVDDNPADVVLVREALANSTYRSRLNSVEDGALAMSFLNRKGRYADAVRPDLVLLDLNLPKKNGLAVLAAIKAGPDLRQIPVVIFSTSELREDVSRSYALGANCYVKKPGNLGDFFSAVKSIEDFWFNLVNLPPGDKDGSTNYEHPAD
jgi:two-component system, chemotaxis family, response regulator Rcp1